MMRALVRPCWSRSAVNRCSGPLMNFTGNGKERVEVVRRKFQGIFGDDGRIFTNRKLGEYLK